MFGYTTIGCIVGINLFPFCRLLLWLAGSVLCHAEAFQCQRFRLLIVDLGANNVLFKKSFPLPMTSRLIPHFVVFQFQCIWFMLRPLSYLELFYDGC